MSLFTGRGDDGTTRLFGGQAKTGAKERISKSSAIAEALGSMDEINSFLGLCKIRSKEAGLLIKGKKVCDLVHEIQKNLFIIQAELAGSNMTIEEGKVKSMEEVINEIENEMPPIKSFFISGGTELAATFDIARTIARRAERRVVQVVNEAPEGTQAVGQYSRAYLNRLSSILYAFARFSNHSAGISEEAPDYK